MKVLFATDGSKFAEIAANSLKLLPLEDVDVEALTVVESNEGFVATCNSEDPRYAELEQAFKDKSKEILKEAKKLFKDKKSWSFTSRMEIGHLDQKILETAKADKIDLICVGSRGLSKIKQSVLGSTSSHIVQHAPCNVLVGHEKMGNPSKNILVAIDGSKGAQKAVEFVASLGLTDDYNVTALSVLSLVAPYKVALDDLPDVPWDQNEEKAKEALHAAKKILSEACDAKIKLRLHEGLESIGEEIHRIAEEEKSDIIVIGNKGRSQLDDFLLGGVAYRVAQYAPCSVIIVR